MNEDLVKIINDWDPIEFFPMAPKDEYYREILSIQEFLEDNEKIKVEVLASKINEIFINAFGEEVYTQNFEECMQVANKIVAIVYL